ncbi:MAG: hypothetical protein IJR95_04910 [Lachnospiraceae bacterium]|nr:hypothetical protein [Lachnospiraceae bacterium]
MKRKWGEKLHRISYMQSSLGLFGCSLLILLALFAASLLSGGGLKLWAGLVAFIGMLMALTGFGLPLYGKFVVGSRDKPDYRWGMLLNGPLFLLYVFFYFLGI